MPNHSSLKGTLMKREILHDMFKISRELQDKVLQYDQDRPADWYQQLDLLSRLVRVFDDDAELLSLYAFILGTTGAGY